MTIAISIKRLSLLGCALILLLSALPAQARLAWEEGASIEPSAEVLDVAYSLDGGRIYVLTAQQEVLVYDAKGELTGKVPVAAGSKRLSAVGLQSAGIPEKLLVAGEQEIQELKIRFAVAIDTDHAPFLGPEDAPVVLVEFSDFQCPYCARVKPLAEQLLLNNDDLKVVFKHFPLSSHEQARPAALAAMAAQEQGKFWEMHDRIFAAQRELSPQKLRAIARDIGLDMERFEQDINSRELAQRLEQDIAAGKEAGVRGTPALFINGLPVTRRDRQSIQQMIDQAREEQQ
ncbi:MAG: thioredoxin domain-containing protein [Desulfurivibrio sp.]|nr:thioredoxin domain-containing protein [Desulfurivibrio sp.]